MANKKYIKTKQFSLTKQMVALKAAYPKAKCQIIQDTLFWTGDIRPSPLSRTYNVLISYNQKKAPEVWVIGDELQKLDAPDFPHHYELNAKNKMVMICLHRAWEFNDGRLLADTIIPWTIEWLYFYEIWLATGEWCGGGEHPTLKATKK